MVELGCGNTCVKYILFVINFLFFVSSHFLCFVKTIWFTESRKIFFVISASSQAKGIKPTSFLM